MTEVLERLESPSVDLIERRNERSMDDRRWVKEAVDKINAESVRSGDTGLILLELPFKHVKIYLKDESAHPSGSLKHRLAESLFLWGLASGRIGPDTTVVECSSGSTAISEAYFARLMGLKFISVLPETTAREKIRLIEAYGGQCMLVPACEIVDRACALSQRDNCHFMDQFTFAEQATDWRSENNIAASIFNQMASEESPIPQWLVVGVGTGGTSTTMGRYLAYNRPDAYTRLCAVDPENSVLFDFYKTRDKSLKTSVGSRIEGIGRPRVEPSFFPELVDRMIKVPDAASVAALYYLKNITGRRFGGSTGTNFIGAYTLAKELEQECRPASIVTLICDDGDRYADTYYNQEWLNSRNIDVANAFHF